MKGARVMLERQLRHLHQPRIETHRCLRVKITILPLALSNDDHIFLYLQYANIINIKSFEIGYSAQSGHISKCNFFFNITHDFVMR